MRDTVESLREEIEVLKKRIEELERKLPLNPFKPIGPPPWAPPPRTIPVPKPWDGRGRIEYGGTCSCGEFCRPGHCINVPA